MVKLSWCRQGGRHRADQRRPGTLVVTNEKHAVPVIVGCHPIRMAVSREGRIVHGKTRRVGHVTNLVPRVAGLVCSTVCGVGHDWGLSKGLRSSSFNDGVLIEAGWADGDRRVIRAGNGRNA